MKSLMFALLGCIVLLTGGYYFFQEKDKPIYARALVLAFIEKEQIIDDTPWQALDLALQVDFSCLSENAKKASACIQRSIKQAIERTQAQYKQLIVLAEDHYADTVVNALPELNNDRIAALVLLNPAFQNLNDNTQQAPKMLVVGQVDSPDATLTRVRRQVANIRNQPNWVWSTQLSDSGEGLFNHAVLPHMTSFLIQGQLNPAYKIEFEAESRWQHPPVNNNAFWKQAEFIQQRAISRDIQRILKAFYAYDTSLTRVWPQQSYQAFNIMQYRDNLPPEQQGRYLTFANRKGHQFYLDLNQYGQFIPEFVVAIDDETNLYRLSSFYKTRQFYSWDERGPDNDMLYVQSLGAFLHFQTPPPVDDELPYLQYSSILFESIAFTDDNPYQTITGLSDKAFNVVTLNCVPCHEVNGVGGAAHHLDYINVQPQAGFAKPLLSYPEKVLNNFFFNQTATAQLIGVNPNYVEQDVGKELIAWLQAAQQ